MNKSNYVTDVDQSTRNGLECYKCGKRNVRKLYMCRSTNSNAHQDSRKENLTRRNNEKKQEVQRSVSRNDQQSSKYQYKSNRKRIRHVEQEQDEAGLESDSESESEDEDINRILKHLNVHRTSRVNSEKNQCKIWINGMEMIVEPDTGADANVMDEYQFNELVKEVPAMEYFNISSLTSK